MECLWILHWRLDLVTALKDGEDSLDEAAGGPALTVLGALNRLA